MFFFNEFGFLTYLNALSIIGGITLKQIGQVVSKHGLVFISIK